MLTTVLTVAFFGGESVAAQGADIPDNISLAPSMTSTSASTFLTRYTGRSAGTGTINTATTRKTSKNRRREERKRARGKKGTVYEEEYLVNSVGRLVERINSVGDEMNRLIEGLVRRGMRERAEAVERGMAEVVGLCRDCVNEVFQVEETSKPEAAAGDEAAAEGEEGERPMGADGVLWDALQDQGRKKEPPVVKAFERLSLLG